MKTYIIPILLILVVVFTACSSEPQYERGNLQGRYNEMSEEERLQTQEEREQVSIAACTEKIEGEICITENQRGDVEGTCQFQEDNLICMFDRQDRSEGIQRE